MENTPAEGKENVSLIDLSEQIPFFIDEKLKRQLCFDETLVISCCHADTNLDNEVETESDVTCFDSSTESVLSEAIAEEEEEEEEQTVSKSEISFVKELEDPDRFEDFHFYFFDQKPPVQKDCSVIMLDGKPAINPRRRAGVCLCRSDISYDPKCRCWATICTCRSKTTVTCPCKDAEGICICNQFAPPAPVCSCEKLDKEICVCFPDKDIRPVCVCSKVDVCTCKDAYPTCPCDIICTCDKLNENMPCPCHKVDAVCVCDPKGIPAPVCSCHDLEKKVCTCFPDRQPRPICICDEGEPCSCGALISPVCTCAYGPNPCTCHDLNETTTCSCGKGIDCKCKKDKLVDTCICKKPEVCFCRSDNVMRPVCTCGIPNACLCNFSTTGLQEKCTCDACTCKLDAVPRPVCVCDNPDACLCIEKKVLPKCKCGYCYCKDDKERTICICDKADACECQVNKTYEKCICDRIPCRCHDDVILPECICDVNPPEPVCICKPKRSSKKEKKIDRYEAFRPCNDVDAQHTYFDFAYNRWDKIAVQEPEPEPPEKFTIVGLHDVSVECPLHPKIKREKQPKKVSLDCCSATGGFTLSIMLMGEDNDRFLIEANSNSTFEGVKTGTRLVSVVDMNLHTLEENRTEHRADTPSTKEHRNYIGISKNGYFQKVVAICDDQKFEKRQYISFEEARNFILEGANLVLLRYIALKRITGTIKTTSLKMNGKPCESVYTCEGISQGVVNNKLMYVVKVTRLILYKEKILYEIRTVMTIKGYIVTHEWVDNNYIIHINPLLQVYPERNDIEGHEPRREHWRKDLQLLSDYLDFKRKRSSEHVQYTAKNPELKNVIRDYFQAILMLNPEDTLEFTKNYFGSVLSDLNIPENEYFDCVCRDVKYCFVE